MTALVGDEFLDNDTLSTEVLHLFSDDIGVTAINAPASGTGLADEILRLPLKILEPLLKQTSQLPYD